MIPQPKTIFDLLNDLTINKIQWSDQSESDRKKFSPYMIHRFLSMHPDYIDLVADYQSIIDNLPPDLCYGFYLDILPKRKFYAKYINGSKDSGKYVKVIDFFAKIMESSRSEVEDMTLLLTELPGGLDLLRGELKLYGHDDKTLKKEFGI